MLFRLAEYSGITKEMLEPITTTIEQIQAFLCTLLSENDIIVGHSLQNDLWALRLVHDHVVDTAVLFRSSNGRTTYCESSREVLSGYSSYSDTNVPLLYYAALKHLTEVLLERSIQSNANDGHCSEEDAVASLELAVKRALLGSTFRIYNSSESRPIHIINCLHNRTLLGENMVFAGPQKWIDKHALSFSRSSPIVPDLIACQSIKDERRKELISAVNEKEKKLIWASLVTAGDEVSMALVDSTLVGISRFLAFRPEIDP